MFLTFCSAGCFTFGMLDSTSSLAHDNQPF